MKREIAVLGTLLALVACGPSEETSYQPVQNTSSATTPRPQPSTNEHAVLEISKTLPTGVTVNEFKADPDIACARGALAGAAHISWNVTGVKAVEVHIGSAGGTLFARTGGTNAKDTKNWVTSGMQFFLQNADSADPNSSSATLAKLTIGQKPGC